jgi:DAACS family dicarboxylate/amino acid:cation (Na+ or H+) symporter
MSEVTSQQKVHANRLPLYVRVLIGVVLGALLGVAFGSQPYLFGLKNEDLGQLGMLVIRLLKALAVPLILFAILDAFARTRITAGRGGKLILICLCNVSVAFVIGLTIMNTLQPGLRWRGRLDQIAGIAQPAPTPTPTPTPTRTLSDRSVTATPQPTLDPLKNVAGYIPESLVEPFYRNNIITVVLLAVLGGAALRRVKDRQQALGVNSIQTVERFIEAVFQILIQMLEWVVYAIPFAVFGVVAHVVGKSGLEVFGALWIFLGTILLGLAVHSLLYYPTVAWVVGRRSPRQYLGQGADAIVTGLSTNSSLATVPVTLRVLTEKLGVSPQSARLSACVGTNLNNDGITLYEAMAALFLAQAYGFDLSVGEQAVVVLASLMAGIGVAGVPEAGLVVLPLVLGAAGLPEAVIAVALPLILPVDWIIARGRSAVNVMSDMLVAILLDAGRRERSEVETPAEMAECAPERADSAVGGDPVPEVHV